MQVVHVVAPCAEEYFPETQSKQNDCWVNAFDLPAGHCVHVEEPSTENVPAVPQDWQTVDAVAPTAVAYFPPGQLVQVDAAAAAYVPALQS